MVIERISELLSQKNMTQKELTDYLGLDKSTFSAWKNGKSKSYNRYLKEIALFLGITVNELIYDNREAESGNKKIKPCPFCGREMKFYRETYKNSKGKEVVQQYYMHKEYDIHKEESCILDEICMPFVIGAGDATEDYIGEYAEKWNRRV